MTRIYVPATIASLGRWHHAGTVPVGALEDGYAAPDDSEEAEYDALMAAAAASADLLDGPGRRVVVVVEVAREDAPASWSEVAAVHADVEERPAGADPEEDLGWFATQEIADLLG